MNNSWLPPIATALVTLPLGAFWMFVWLIGTNGYSERQGGTILASILALVLIATLAAMAASRWLAARASARWPGWAAVIGTLLIVLVGWAMALGVGSLIILLLLG